MSEVSVRERRWAASGGNSGSEEKLLMGICAASGWDAVSVLSVGDFTGVSERFLLQCGGDVGGSEKEGVDDALEDTEPRDGDVPSAGGSGAILLENLNDKVTERYETLIWGRKGKLSGQSRGVAGIYTKCLLGFRVSRGELSVDQTRAVQNAQNPRMELFACA
jgi:hypothetical protein